MRLKVEVVIIDDVDAISLLFCQADNFSEEVCISKWKSYMLRNSLNSQGMISYGGMELWNT
jgi:hypothetical protein